MRLAGERSRLKELFACHRLVRAVIDCGLETAYGEVFVDDLEQPGVARLDIGCYSFFAGDPGNADDPDEPGSLAAETLVAEAPAPIELMFPDSTAWRDLALRIHGRRLEDRPMRTFATHGLSIGQLRRIAGEVPDGYTVRRIGPAEAEQLDDGILPHALPVFGTVDAFLRDGFGFGVMDGERLACAATTYTVSSRHSEVAISTRESHRGRGLAPAASATLILHSLENDLEPAWSATNPVSKRLALRLGYRIAPMADSIFLHAAD